MQCCLVQDAKSHLQMDLKRSNYSHCKAKNEKEKKKKKAAWNIPLQAVHIVHIPDLKWALQSAQMHLKPQKDIAAFFSHIFSHARVEPNLTSFHRVKR